MSTFDDPNRESVGQPPIWTGAGEGVEPHTSSSGYDPGEHTVAEVQEYLEKNPDQYNAVLAAEKAGKARTGLTGE